jgi:L,D-peptidoglycan transpeptidase YkuD (ErfK/YbiS/YcfS/YnhG family)
MVIPRRAWISLMLVAVVGLPLLIVAYRVWALTGVRERPWYFEVNLGSALAECRTGSGALWFQRDYEELEARYDDAVHSVLEVDRRWWPWRDYSESMTRLLAVALDTRLLELRMHQRRQEQKEKARVFRYTLEQALASGGGTARIWSRFARRSIDEERARRLAREADQLSAHGESASALTEVLRAWVSLQRYKRSSESEFARFEDSVLVSKWQRQTADLLKWTRQTGRRAVLVDKLGHRCLLLNRGRVEDSFEVNLGRNWHERKVQEHDASTPEGEYSVKRMIPAGKYGRALLLDYPNHADRERFSALKREGVLSVGSRIGSSIEIHGRGRPDTDWTDGCVSLRDADMQKLYDRAYPGMRVTIVGTTGLIPSQ